MKKPFIYLFFLTLGYQSTALAVTVATQNPVNPSNQAPANGAPWDNVLFSNTASSIYLGGGWVVSAEHVFDDVANPFVTFNGVNFERDPNFQFVIQNPNRLINDGLVPRQITSDSDVVLFRLNSELPGLPTINIGTVTTGTNITMIGFGGGKTWGLNQVAATNFAIAVDGLNDVVAFQTTYESALQSEGQGAVGDSGGAGFYQDPVTGEWLLGGIMSAIGTVNGVESTFFSDFNVYADEINNLITVNGSIPEPSVAVLSSSALLLLLRRKR